MPDIAVKCINSWKAYCPDYKIIEWNESNYNLGDMIPYVLEAMAEKKWAFATDYIRLDLIYKYGGIYLDTDVELQKSLDDLLKEKGFLGMEDDCYINTGLGFGAEAGLEIVKNLRDDYSTAHFKRSRFSNDTTPCPQRNTQLLKKYGFVPKNDIQTCMGTTIYPKEYFSPKSFITGEITLTSNTYSIHWFSGTWRNSEDEKEDRRIEILSRLLGKKVGKKCAGVLNYISKRKNTRN